MLKKNVLTIHIHIHPGPSLQPHPPLNPRLGSDDAQYKIICWKTKRNKTGFIDIEKLSNNIHRRVHRNEYWCDVGLWYGMWCSLASLMYSIFYTGTFIQWGSWLSLQVFEAKDEIEETIDCCLRLCSTTWRPKDRLKWASEPIVWYFLSLLLSSRTIDTTVTLSKQVKAIVGSSLFNLSINPHNHDITVISWCKTTQNNWLLFSNSSATHSTAQLRPDRQQTKAEGRATRLCLRSSVTLSLQAVTTPSLTLSHSVTSPPNNTPVLDWIVYSAGCACML